MKNQFYIYFNQNVKIVFFVNRSDLYKKLSHNQSNLYFSFPYNFIMKEKFLINGGRQLSGEIVVEASKNAYLPILAGCVLCDEKVTFLNAPEFLDIENMCAILKLLGARVRRVGAILELDMGGLKNQKISFEYTNKLRASIFLLGALLGKFRQAVISYPGGCNIGTRPIDIHISAFKSLGVKVVERHGYIFCNAQNMRAGKVVFPSVSVGATESLVMSAVLLKGKTTLYNSAREPEVVELCKFLNAMGAKIYGAGTDVIEIYGVKKLRGVEFSVQSDRIIAGTHLLLGALAGKNLKIVGAKRAENERLFNILDGCACDIFEDDEGVVISAVGRSDALKFVETLPYPNFPTDLQPQLMAFATLAKGTSVIRENLFENRFNHVMEYTKMGADILVKDRIAIVRGVEKLFGADVFATDLRAGAGLVLVGLLAEGYTTVHNVEFIDRGYERLEEKYAKLGADIKRVKD